MSVSVNLDKSAVSSINLSNKLDLCLCLLGVGVHGYKTGGGLNNNRREGGGGPKQSPAKFRHARISCEDPLLLAGLRMHSDSVWPDNGVKSYLNVSKSCRKSIHSSFYINSSISIKPKSHQSFRATFVASKFAEKNFQKSPNLVTLHSVQFFLFDWSANDASGERREL